jgi:hypothetical protein
MFRIFNFFFLLNTFKPYKILYWKQCIFERFFRTMEGMPKSRISPVFISENFTPFHLQFSTHPLNEYTSISRAPLLLQPSCRALTTQPPRQYSSTTTTYRSASFLDQNNVLAAVDTQKTRKHLISKPLPSTVRKWQVSLSQITWSN